MKNSGSKCFLIFVVFFCSCYAVGQPNSEGNQSLIIIIGNSVSSDNISDFLNTNPYTLESAPPPQKHSNQNNFIIEPTLENGFHMRFEVGSVQSADTFGPASFLPSNESFGKTKKLTFLLNQRVFNFKKKIRTWFPKRKKKYKPHLCGRF